MRTRSIPAALLPATLLAAGLCLGACGDDAPGAGTLEVTTWGEDFIETGIPAAALEDGWAVTYHTFVVSLGGVTAAGGAVPGAWAVDVSEAGPHTLATQGAGEGEIAPVTYAMAPVTGSTTNVNVDEALFDEMRAAGWSVYVAGEATKDGSTVTFAWGFDVSAGYHQCEAAGTVPDGGTGVTQLTIHGDHLLYESLVDEEAGLRFQVIADADADGDGEVTAAVLAAVSGTAFLALDHYDVPPGSGIDNLWAYLAAQVRTLGHIDGEGHCHPD